MERYKIEKEAGEKYKGRTVYYSLPHQKPSSSFPTPTQF